MFISKHFKKTFLILSALLFCLFFNVKQTWADQPSAKKNMNLLLLGVDARSGENSRSDTIMLLNIHENKINIISIPRDTMVDIESKGTHKINAAYALGGIELCKNTIEKLFQTDIDDYIVVNFQAVEQAIDALGGVNINIPSDISISNPEFKRYVYLKKGKHKLNGFQAIEYLRYRSDAQADIGRIARQQGFLQDLQKDFIKIENISKVPKLYDVVSKNVKTDLDPFTLAEYFENACKLGDNINFYTLKGSGEYINQVAYYITDRNSLQSLIKLIGE